MEAFSTPFDETAVEFLEDLKVPRYKIASLEIVDLPLIRQVAQTGKPVIISTGTATLGEIEDAVTAAQDGGAKDITLLVCTSSYPAKPEDAHLARIPVLKDLFGVNVGLSDHTVGLAVAVAAVALGATMIEKHVTLARADGGVDAEFSAEPAEMKTLVEACHDAAKAIGSTSAWRTDAEAESTRLRPSLYVTASAKAGDVITHDNVRSVRPGGGLAPKHLDVVIGQKFVVDVEPGTPVQWGIVG
jgi:N-acetylneuraminate synthase